jgi:hypothetical protein
MTSLRRRQVAEQGENEQNRVLRDRFSITAGSGHIRDPDISGPCGIEIDAFDPRAPLLHQSETSLSQDVAIDPVHLRDNDVNAVEHGSDIVVRATQTFVSRSGRESPVKKFRSIRKR